MLSGLYARWMIAWETALTTRDENRVERPLEWGFEELADYGGLEAAARVGRGESSALEEMSAINRRIVAEPESFFGYRTPTDFRIEQRFPELHPTNVRPETLEMEREWRRRAEVGELRREPFLRWTSAVRTGFEENDQANARWYPEKQTVDSRQGDSRERLKARRKRRAMVVMPQWNADAFSHNALCELFNRFGIACLRLSKPYHDVRRPAELERADYAVSANIGRTMAAARQAVADVRSAVDWLEAQGYEQFGVLGTSLGSCYAFLAAAMDPRIEVCAFNHASTWFGDVVWTGQSTRHVRAALEHAGLTREDVRAVLAGISPKSFMRQYALAKWRRTLVVHATYDLTFLPELSLDVLKNFEEYGIRYVSKVLPCGHYTTGETPYKFLDGWYLGSFVWRAFREPSESARGSARA
ncbi:MAG TPA: alpha/beta hydrolase family protein [Acidobacteriaceae bacterium]|jgi:pimeloyl-ACP methyl ester carboxylesterase|nr:alpha/beta hydrolase family protein [Acidobacteriaceae bacterium]